ncbi:MAG: porin [Hyphomicrobiales bacterium]|nr:porin [Hyphomicrobiales bacterium]
MGTMSKDRRIPVICMAGAVIAAAGVISTPRAALAQSLDAVLQRLDKLEKENAALRARVNGLEAGKGHAAAAAAPVTDPSKFKGNPVQHGAVATSPAPAPTVSVGGMPVKAGPIAPLVDNTTVTIYGHADLSLDAFNPSVFDQGTKLGIASNGSYFGIRARHNLAPYGWEGYSVVAQFESQVDVAAAPTERAALGTRDSYLGLEGPWGAIKAGKSDTPYKKATAAFDPFANTVADYNSIMGNTGGDNRAEFDWRMNHAIWYESPIWNGFQFSALFSPGQNYATDNSDYSYGDYFQCNGASTRGSGSNFPGTGGSLPGNIGGNGCTDGSFGNAFSVAGTYKNGPFTAIAAYEYHQSVNRHGDDGLENQALAVPVFLPDGSQVFTGVADEWAAKVGGGYRFDNPLGPLQVYAYYEWLRREVAPGFEPFNERSRDGWFVSATQSLGTHWSVSASWAHAGDTPGAPTCLSLNNPNAPIGCVSPGPIVQSGQFQQNAFSEVADMYALGTKYRFNNWASWYLVGAWLQNGMGAHYCLGASGHGYQICSRDQFNDTIGGAAIKAVSTGMTFDF